MKKLTIITAIALVLSVSCKDTTKKEVETPSKETEAPTVKIKGEEVTYAADSTNLEGYIAYNENATEKRPGIIIVHEWWGHNDYVRKRADMLADLGYTALAVDMYGNGKQAKHPEDAGKFSSMVMGNIDVAQARFDAAMQLLRNHPTVNQDNIAAIGYCFGGSVVLTMANAGKDLDAVAAFHSGVKLPVMPNDKLQAKVLVANGAADPFVSKESVENFKRAMDSINADYKYIAYEGAKHAYTSKDADSLGKKFDLPLAYDAEADKKSWNSLQTLLEDTFNTSEE